MLRFLRLNHVKGTGQFRKGGWEGWQHHSEIEVTDKMGLGSFERKNYTNQENVFPFCPSLSFCCLWPASESTPLILRASVVRPEAIRGQDLGGLKPAICKFPLHKEFQGIATATKSKPETCCTPQLWAMKYSLPLSFGGRGETAGRGHRKRSIHQYRKGSWLPFLPRSCPLHAATHSPKIKHVFSSKNLGPRPNCLLQVPDFVRDRTCPRSPAQTGGLLHTPVPPGRHRHTAYYTCSPHPSCSPRPQAASGPGPPSPPSHPATAAHSRASHLRPPCTSQALRNSWLRGSLPLSPSTLRTRPWVRPPSRTAAWTPLWWQLCVCRHLTVHLPHEPMSF